MQTIHVQFVGEDVDRSALRNDASLSVSVTRLRKAFQWLSVNCWPFMVATKTHEVYEDGSLGEALEELLGQYEKSVGGVEGGAPAELVQAASRISASHATVHQSGPANATADDDRDDETADPAQTTRENDGNGCAAAIDGGVDDLTPLQLWDSIMKNLKVQQVCEEELKKLKEG